MLATGYSHGHLTVMPKTSLRTSRKLSMSPGGSLEESSLPKKKKSGTSTLSLALLDRIIPITHGGKNDAVVKVQSAL